MNYSIGVDIGGTTIKAGIVDERFNIVFSKALPTRSMPGADDGERVANCVVQLIRDLCEEVGITVDQLVSIGAGMPGTVDADNGVVLYANNIHMKDVPLRQMVYERIGRTMYMGNDADVAAWGEYMAGATAGCGSSIMITLGTGVGGGIIADGKIYTGWHSRGGELGHAVVEAGGWDCTCGRQGCLEAYASATGLIRMTKESMEKSPDSAMWKLAQGDIAKVDGKTAFDAMAQGDAAGLEVVNTYIRYLACGIANFINMLHPHKVCIGGGISKSGDDLLLPLRRETYKEVYGGADENTTEIVLATLGNNAGIIGAAMLGRR